MSNAKLERKRQQGRVRTARWRQVRHAEKETALVLAELRTKQLMALLRALHTDVDAADEAGEDDWFWTGTELSRCSDMGYEIGSPAPENVVWRNSIRLPGHTPRLVYVKVQQTGSIQDKWGGHLGDIPFSHGVKLGILREGPKALSEANCNQLELPVIDWADASQEKACVQEVLTAAGDHLLTAVHIPWEVAAGIRGKPVTDIQAVFRDVTVATRTAATKHYNRVSGASIGRHIEVGWGCMAGSSRKETVEFADGTSSLLPFWRNENKNIPRFHDAMSEAGACLAELMHAIHPKLLQGYNRGALPWHELAKALTYPLPLPGRAYLHGAQCASRVRGSWLEPTAAESSAATRTSCDLHCDTQVHAVHPQAQPVWPCTP